MHTPTGQHLEGLCSYLATSLQDDTDLQNELGLQRADGHKICQRGYPCRIFDASSSGIAFYTTEFPAVGVYVDRMTSQRLRGGEGFACDLGVQYVLKGNVGDGMTNGWLVWGKMHLIMMMVAWKIRDYLQLPSAQLAAYHIERLYLDTFEQLPPTGDGVFTLQGMGQMDITWPPWKTTSDAKTLVELDGEITETSDAGGDPQVIATHTVRGRHAADETHEIPHGRQAQSATGVPCATARARQGKPVLPLPSGPRAPSCAIRGAMV